MFLPGLQLCRLFYEEVVAPLLTANFPDLRYSAALIGSGSEVLGFDTEMSSDHCWGPRVLLFLEAADYDRLREPIEAALCCDLPRRFRGFATYFDRPQAPQGASDHHRIEMWTVPGFFQDYLGFDIQQEIAPADWLTFPEQKLRTITAGAVYADGTGLQAVRERFTYYPHDVWLYLLAAGWTRIGQEEHLMGRAGSVGDEIGAAIIASRLVRDLMRLCFLMEKQYAPYPKWFGTAFARLACAPELSPVLRRVQRAETWQERQEHLAAAYEIVAALHNRIGITSPRPTKAEAFFNRPFKVIELGGSFAEAIKECIRDPVVQRIASRRLIGSVDQFSDSTDLLSEAGWRRTLHQLYEETE